MIWFTFNGVSSASYGIYLEARLPEIVNAPQIDFSDVNGRDGAIMQDFGGHEDAEIEVSAYQTGAASYGAARAWLRGSGLLIPSYDPAHGYRITISGAIEYTRLSRTSAIRQMRIPMRIAPFREILPAASAITVHDGDIIENPGSAYSMPKIKITGTGDVTLTIGDQHIDIDGMEAGAPIIIDSRLMECMDETETELKNGMVVMDEFPRLEPGDNPISWTGTITELKILEPRWRDV